MVKIVSGAEILCLCFHDLAEVSDSGFWVLDDLLDS